MGKAHLAVTVLDDLIIKRAEFYMRFIRKRAKTSEFEWQFINVKCLWFAAVIHTQTQEKVECFCSLSLWCHYAPLSTHRNTSSKTHSNRMTHHKHTHTQDHSRIIHVTFCFTVRPLSLCILLSLWGQFISGGSGPWGRVRCSLYNLLQHWSTLSLWKRKMCYSLQNL